MVAKVIGNRAAYITGTGGVGAAFTPDLSVGWTSVIGKAGDVAYIGVAGLNRKSTDLGYYVQGGSGVSATIDFTLANEAAATSGNPQYQALVPWDTANAVTVSTTVQLIMDKTNKFPLAFTAMKITFASAGEIYIMSR